MSKTMALLIAEFCRDGKVAWSGTDTCAGTKAQWLYLEREGLVKRMNKSGRGCLGHDHAYYITDVGRAAAVEALKEGA